MTRRVNGVMLYFDGLQALKQNTKFTKRIRGIEKVFVGCYTGDFNISSIIFTIKLELVV
jgi:hypothetical protein